VPAVIDRSAAAARRATEEGRAIALLADSDDDSIHTLRSPFDLFHDLVDDGCHLR
jgi:hypothetical protein